MFPVFALCDEVCHTPTWHNQTPEGVWVSLHSQLGCELHASTLFISSCSEALLSFSLYRLRKFRSTEPWEVMKSEGWMIRSWSCNVLVCVCVTAPPLIFLLMLKGLFSTAAACFGVVHLFYSTAWAAVLRRVTLPWFYFPVLKNYLFSAGLWCMKETVYLLTCM